MDLFFGLAKLGAILVPVNWRLACPELEYLLSDSAPKVLLYGTEYEDTVKRLQPKLVVAHYLDLSEHEEILRSSSPHPQPPAIPSLNGPI